MNIRHNQVTLRVIATFNQAPDEIVKFEPVRSEKGWQAAKVRVNVPKFVKANVLPRLPDGSRWKPYE